MFEKEINEIMNKYNNSCELLKRLHEIYDDYNFDGSKKNDIFYLDVRIGNIDSPERIACNHLCDMLTNRGLKAPYRYGGFSIIKELLEIIKPISVEDFYFRLATNASICSNYEFNKTEYKETRVYSARLNLILDCIYLLDNPEEPTPSDILCKIEREYLHTGKPFIFKDCKVISYKNHNLKITFSSPELFKKFKNNFEKAIEKYKSKAT